MESQLTNFNGKTLLHARRTYVYVCTPTSKAMNDAMLPDFLPLIIRPGTNKSRQIDFEKGGRAGGRKRSSKQGEITRSEDLHLFPFDDITLSHWFLQTNLQFAIRKRCRSEYKCVPTRTYSSAKKETDKRSERED